MSQTRRASRITVDVLIGQGKSKTIVEENGLRFHVERAAKRNYLFDIIILDPPSFARFEGTVFSIKKDLPLLIEKALRALTVEGMLFVSTNLSSISRARLEERAHLAAKKTERKIIEANRPGQDIEFLGSGLMKESFLSVVLLKTVLLHAP